MRITVDVEHRTAVTSSWYSVWAGAVAVGAMCINMGFEGGIAGVSGGLSVTVHDTGSSIDNATNLF